MHSKPITPKHEPPKVAGGQFKSVADDDDRRFFSDFAEFAMSLIGGWQMTRLEPIGDCKSYLMVTSALT
jgi:hypothetical protein